jgi:alpha-galactosidase
MTFQKNLFPTFLLLLFPLLTVPSDGAKIVRVFVLAGQSNMVGHGKVEYGLNPEYDPNQPGSQREIKGGLAGLRRLATDPKTAPDYQGLLDDDGQWVERDDVFIYSTAPGREKGKLTVGFGKGSWFGPELGFGREVGNHCEEPVLLIKTAWGGHSLGIKFRPPSSGDPAYEKTNFKKDEVGSSYHEMMGIVASVCENLGESFPELEGYEPQISGFGWHQGWNDAGSEEMVAEYDKNMTNLIHDIRKAWNKPNLPVVIANTGMIGKEATGRRAELCEIQLAMADPRVHPEFAGTVSAIETRGFKRPTSESPSGFGYHWNHNAESHFLVGTAMGEAMVKLLEADR